MLRFLSSLLFACLVASAPLAQTVTWTGAGDGTTFSDGANWSTGTAPADNDDVAVALGGTYTITVDQTPSLNSLALSASGATLDLGDDTGGAGGAFWSLGSFTMSGGTVRGDGAFVSASAFAWSGGTITGVNSSLQLFDGFVTIEGAGTLILDGWTLEMGQGARIATTNAAIGLRLLLRNRATLLNYFGQTFEIASDNVLIRSDQGVPGRLFSEGRVTKTAGTASAQIEAALTGGGVLDVQVGTLTVVLPDGSHQHGGVEGAAGGTLVIQGRSTATTLDLANGTVDTDGSLTLDGGTYQLGSQTYRVGETSRYTGTFAPGDIRFGPDANQNVSFGDLEVIGAGTQLTYDGQSNGVPPIAASLDLNSARIVSTVGGSNGDLDVLGTATLFGGTLEGGAFFRGATTWSRTNFVGGTVVVFDSISLDDPGSLDGTGLQVLSDAAATWTSGSFAMPNSGGITVDGLFDVQTASTVSGGVVFVNAGGTLRSSQPGSAVIDALVFNSGGTVDVAQGEVLFLDTFDSGFEFRPGRIEGAGTIGLSGGYSGFGTIGPGPGTAVLAVEGGLDLDRGVLEIEIGGTTPGTEHDQLAATGAVVLSGTLNATAVDGYTVQTGDEVVILTASSVSGTFDAVAVPDGLDLVIEADRVVLRNGSAPPDGTYTWTGNGDGTSWSDAANWDVNAVPLDGQDVVIDLNEGTNYTVVVDVDPDIASLAVTSTRASLDVAQTLNVSGLSTLTSSVSGDGTLTTGSLDLAASVRMTGALIVTGQTTWRAGSIFGAGLVAFDGGATITAGGARSGNARRVSSGTLRLGGVSTLPGYIDLTFGGTVEVPVGAELQITADDAGIRPLSGTVNDPTIRNAGRIVKTGGSASSFDGTFLGNTNSFNFGDRSVRILNTGEIATEAGVLLAYPSAASEMGGRFDADAGTQIVISRADQQSFAPVAFTGDLAGAGTVEVRYGFTLSGTIDVTGRTVLGNGVTVAPDATIASLGTLQITGNVGDTVRFQTPGAITAQALVLAFGGFDLTPDLTVTGDAEISNAALSGPGRITILGDAQVRTLSATAGGDLTVQGAVTTLGGFEGSVARRLVGRRLVLNGTGILDNGSFRLGEGGDLVVGAGARVEIRESLDITPAADDGTGDPGIGRVVVQGTLAKTEAGTVAVSVPIVNTGTVDVAEGTLQADGAVDNDGSVEGVATLALGAPLDNAGRIAPAGEVAGTLSVTGNLGIGPGTLVVDLGGVGASDQLAVSGTATLGGTLDATALAGYTPTAGDEIVILTAGAVSGTFDTVTVPDGLTVVYDANRVVLRAESSNADPVAQNDEADTDEDTAVVIAVLANDSDSDGGTLQIIDTTGGDFGSTVISGNGTTVTYTPNADVSGTDQFGYTISDGQGGTASASVAVTIRPVNDAPVAVADQATTDEDTDVTVEVLANDTDVDGPGLTVTSAQGPTNGTVTTDGATVTYSPNADFFGTDSFTYTVSDGDLSDTGTVTVTVASVNDDPVAVADDASTTPGTAVEIEVTANDTDADGDVLEVTEAVGADSGTVEIVSMGTVRYTPNDGFTGTDQFTYVVTDNNGGTASATVAVTVNATVPIARDDEAETAEDTAVEVLVLANDESRVSAPLAVVAASGADSGTVEITGDGTAVTYTPNADFFGTDQFSYTIEDSGGQATATVTVTVLSVNDAPVAQADAASTDEDTAVEIAVLANDSDPDGDALAITAASGATLGTVAVAADGLSLVYTPGLNASGTDQLTYTVSDGDLTASATVDVVIRPVNDAPVAVADDASTGTGQSVTVPVLANDSDVDGDVLTVISVAGADSGSAEITDDGTTVTYTPNAGFEGTDQFSYTISDGNGGSASATVTVAVDATAPIAQSDDAATDEDTAVEVSVLANDQSRVSAPLAVVAIGDAANGAVAITGGGTTVTYTPDADFFGTDQFSYTIEDSGGRATATVTVTVAPVNDAPIAIADAYSTGRGADLVVEAPGVVANDSDPEGDELVSTLVTGPASGSLDLGTDGGFSYTPPSGFEGIVTFEYAVSDGDLSDTATVTITVGGDNVPPVAANDDATTDEDTAVEVLVLANDADANGDDLTVTAASGATLGTVAVAVDGQSVLYTPALNVTGTDQFAYTVSDGTLSATATVSVTITPVNDAPVAQADDASTAFETAVDIAVLANDGDVDGDALSVTEAGNPENGTVTIGTGGQSVTYTPADGFSGTDSFSYTVSDGDLSDTATVTVAVAPPGNRAPIAVADDASTAEDTAVEIPVLANDSDPDGDDLAVSDVSEPTNGSAVTDGTTVTYTPDTDFSGTDSFTYTISDGVLTASATVTVTVTGANDGPIAQDDAVTTPEDTAIEIPVLANDSDPDGDALTVTSTTDAASGTVVTDGTTVTYTPNADVNGTDSFVYTVSDGNGGTASATVTVTISPVNDAPLAVNDDATASTGDRIDIAVLDNDRDPDGDDLTVASVSGATGGTFTTDGTTVAFTPEAGFTGTATATYTVTDGELTDTAEIRVVVSGTNQPPIARDDAAPVRSGDSVLIDVLANDSDPEGGALSIVSVQAPASGGTAATEAGQIRYTAPSGFSGTDTFTYTIADPQGATATATVTLTAQAYRFALTDLGTLGGTRSAAMAVAADGRVVGTAEDGTGTLRPTLWTSGAPTALALTDTPSGFAAAIDGQAIVGVRYAADGQAQAFRLGPGAGTLPGLGGTLTSAFGVREGGVVVGSSARPAGGIEALAWDAAGVATPLGTFGLANSEAFGVSPLGVVVGTAQTDTEARAFAGTRLLAGDDGRAYAANASGTVVGSTAGASGDVSAVRWTGDGAPEPLGSLGGGFAEAYAVNGAGWVVGASGVSETAAIGQSATARTSATPERRPLPLGGRLAPSGSPDRRASPAGPATRSGATDAATARTVAAIDTRAVLWVDGETLDLGTIIDVPGWTLVEARGINDAGQIVGTGLVDGQPRAFLLTPTDNAAPRAADDRAETAMGQPVEIVLVANDSDTDGDALAVASLVAPRHGSVERIGPQAVRYTPAPGFSGEDSFHYTVADGRGGLAQAEVRVRVRAGVPGGLSLRAPAPNPASGAVAFVFTLDAPADDVRLHVTDVLGRSLLPAFEGSRDAGEHTVRIDVGALAPGLYVCRLLAGDRSLTRTFTVVR